MADVLHRLERLGVEYFNCNADSTWTQVCTAAGVPKNQRKLYYQYLSEQHGYGHVPPVLESETTEQIPWFKFDDPTVRGRASLLSLSLGTRVVTSEPSLKVSHQ
eukprot:COSAG05_NODE_337_length_11164_cov_11.970357_8_plen_104_part_00